jgi:hypothetical protein
MPYITIKYTFILNSTQVEEFAIKLDKNTLALITKDPPVKVPWTELTFHQCPNCTLSRDSVELCPVASCLATIVKGFENLFSYDKVHLEVTTCERKISESTTIQRAIASYMGLVMATCGCPNTNFLRPMARFHLPLASEAETIYRAFTMYALAQYFVKQEGGTTDYSFKGLEQKYRNLLTVNESLLIRLKAASDKDSSINALLNLDVYARAMPYVIEDKLDELKHLFVSYFEEKK